MTHKEKYGSGYFNYYIIKPKTKLVDEVLQNKIEDCNKNCKQVFNICEADVVVCQQNWTRSKSCLQEYAYAKQERMIIQEFYVYEKLAVKLN